MSPFPDKLQEDILQRQLRTAAGKQRPTPVRKAQEHLLAHVGSGARLHRILVHAHIPLAQLFDADDIGQGGEQFHHVVFRPLDADHQLVVARQLCGQVVRRAVRHNLPLVDDKDAVTHSLHLRQDVGGQDDGVPFRKAADKVADVDNLFGVETHGGLVQNQHIRVADQRLGKPHTLTVALGQVADQALLHALQARAGRGVRHCGGTIRLFAGALQLGNEQQILLHGHLLIQRRQLRQVADAGLSRGGLVGDVVAVDFDRAVRGRNVAGNNVHGGRFARAVGAEQAEDLAVAHRKGQIFNGRVHDAHKARQTARMSRASTVKLISSTAVWPP